VAGLALLFWTQRHLFTPRADGHRIAADLWEFATAERRFVTLQLQGRWPLAVGDPIYRIDGPDTIEQVGEIRRPMVATDRSPTTPAAGPTFEALLYPHAPPLVRGSYMEYFTTPRSMKWVMETMLPAKKRAAIAQEIVAAYRTYHAEILEALKPVVIAGFADTLRVAERELTREFTRRRDALERIADRYQEDVVRKKIVPLVREQIWPIVRRHAEPLARKIGQEMFSRASLWRFGWRLAYDKSFLPQKNLAQAEWQRFVDEEAIPILNRHRGEFAAVQRKIVEEIAEDPTVRETVRVNLTQLIDDPELRTIVWHIFRDGLFDNPRVRRTLEERWSSAEARRAVQLAADYVEPSVRRIGDLLIGTRADGISPEFAQVVRNQILDKDRRWLVIVTPVKRSPSADAATDRTVPVRHGGLARINPFAVELRGDIR
jgi:hypothetical protein